MQIVAISMVDMNVPATVGMKGTEQVVQVQL